MYQTLNLTYKDPLYQRINNVMLKLMEANRQEIRESGVTSWEIHVIDEPSISNAMVLPVGFLHASQFIMITSSCFLLPVLLF